MITEEERDRIAEQISGLFLGPDLEDVADILTVHLAMLMTQEADSAEHAVEFLDETRDSTEEIVRTVSFEDDDPAEAEGSKSDRC